MYPFIRKKKQFIDALRSQKSTILENPGVKTDSKQCLFRQHVCVFGDVSLHSHVSVLRNFIGTTFVNICLHQS